MKTLDEILNFLHFNPNSSRAEITNSLENSLSPATIKRILADAISKNLICANGKGRACRYSITPKAHLLRTYNIEEYFKKEIDERIVQTSFNFDLLENLLPTTELFSSEELSYLNNLQQKFQNNISNISVNVYNSEMERLGIDLSWKSSQIEGNTYSRSSARNIV